MWDLDQIDPRGDSISSVLGKVRSLQEPCFYRSVTNTVFVKTSADPLSEKITKVKMAPGTSIRTTGKMWSGKHGNVWAELDSKKYNEWRWVCVLGPGFGATCPLLAAEEEYGLLVGKPRPRIPRKKPKPEPETQEACDEPVENPDNEEPTARPAHFKVACETANVYKTPNTRSSTIGSLNTGQTLFGLPYSFSGNPWLKIDAADCNDLFPGCNSNGWVLIHGSCMGQGQLLKTLPGEEEQQLLERRFGADTALAMLAQRPGSAEEAAKAEPEEMAGTFEVVDAELIVRPEPSFAAASLGSIASGKITTGTVETVGGARWLCIEEAECRKKGLNAKWGWAPFLGSNGPAVRMLTAEEERTYLRAQSELDKEREKMEEAKREAERQRQALEQEKAALEEQRRAMEAAAAQAAAAQAAAAQAAIAQAAAAQAAAAQAAASQAAAAQQASAQVPPADPAQVAPTPSAPATAATSADTAESPLSPAGPAVPQEVPTQPVQSLGGSEPAAHAAPAGDESAPIAKTPVAQSPVKEKQKVTKPPGEVKDWTVDDVITYLESLELGKYTEAFRENSIDGEFLLELSEADLMQECGIPKLSAKKVKIMLTK